TGSASVAGNQVIVNYGPGAMTPTALSDLITLTMDTPGPPVDTVFYFSVTPTTFSYAQASNIPLFAGSSVTITVKAAAFAYTNGVGSVTPNYVPTNSLRTFTMNVNNTGANPAVRAHVYVPAEYNFGYFSASDITVTGAVCGSTITPVNTTSFPNNGSTKRVDIHFAGPGGGLPGGGSCQVVSTNITTPAQAQSRNWSVTLDTALVSAINVTPSAAGAFTVNVPG